MVMAVMGGESARRNGAEDRNVRFGIDFLRKRVLEREDAEDDWWRWRRNGRRVRRWEAIAFGARGPGSRGKAAGWRRDE